jgi:serine phosphatase RsbU (regulator of sigma subunit)
MSFLTVQTPDGDIVRFVLSTSTVRLGRASENELVLDDATVSRRHALIDRREQGDYLVDVGGSNGVTVNGLLIGDPALLRAGDVVGLGRTRLVYCAPAIPPSELGVTPWPGTGETMILATDNLPLLEPSKISRESAEFSLLPILLEADQELAVDRPLNEMFAKILDLVQRIVPFERGVLQTLEGDDLVSQIVRRPSGTSESAPGISEALKNHVIHSREAILVVDALDDAVLKKRRSIQSQSVRSLMCVPLTTRQNEVLGLLYVDDRHEAGRFNEQNLRFLTHLGNLAASKLENKRLFDRVLTARLYEEDSRRAAEMQRYLLPKEAPAIPGYALAGVSHPCLAVGGDYFDYLELSDGCFGVAVGDVVGHGVPAALLMCSLQSSFRALVEQGLPPGEVMSRLNVTLSRRLPLHCLITLFYGVLDPGRHTLTYANAGHTLPFILGSQGATELAKGGPPLGVWEERGYGSRDVSLEQGDSLVMYSDGISEAFNPDGEEFGAQRLMALAGRLRSASPDEMLRGILGGLDSHCGAVAIHDDVTLVVMKRDR